MKLLCNICNLKCVHYKEPNILTHLNITFCFQNCSGSNIKTLFESIQNKTVRWLCAVFSQHKLTTTRFVRTYVKVNLRKKTAHIPLYVCLRMCIHIYVRSYICVCIFSSFSRSVPLLKSLHWLPAHYRILFKICIIAYQAVSSTRPAYLNSMLTSARNFRQLRSTSSNSLYIPRVKTKAGTRAFSVAAPTASVKLEGSIVSFRSFIPISFMLPILLSVLSSSSIHRRLTHYFTI